MDEMEEEKRGLPQGSDLRQNLGSCGIDLGPWVNGGVRGERRQVMPKERRCEVRKEPALS